MNRSLKFDWSSYADQLTPILAKIDLNTYLALLVGAGLSWFFTIYQQERNCKYTRKEFKKTLCSQFRELRLRLALLSYSEMIETGAVNTKNLRRLCNCLTDIKNNEDVDKWRELQQMDEDKLKEIDEIKNDRGQTRTLNRHRVPALEEAISSIQLLEPRYQQPIFSLMTKFDWLNGHIDEYNHYAKMLLDMPLNLSGDIQQLTHFERKKERLSRLRLYFAKQIAALSALGQKFGDVFFMPPVFACHRI